MPQLIPPYPGETIVEDVLKRLDMSVNQLATNPGGYGNPPQRHRSRPAQSHCRHGPALGSVSGNIGRILAWTST